MFQGNHSSHAWRALGASLVCLASVVTSREPTLVVAAAGVMPPFADCEPPAGQRWSYDNLMCLRQAGTTHDVREEVVGRLRAMGAGDVEHPWPTLVLAHVTLDQLQRAPAIALYEAAAAGFARSGEAEGEIVARQNLANQFRLRGEIEIAAGHVARAAAAAEASKDPLLIARAGVIEAVHSMATGGDIGRAHRVLVRADRLVPSSAPIGLRRTILFNLAQASLHLGYAGAAIDALEHHRALRAEDGSAQNAATVEVNLLAARLMLAEQRPLAGARHRLVANAEAVLGEAAASTERMAEAYAHRVLGELLAASEPERAAFHVQRCLDIEAALGYPRLRAECLWWLSRVQSSRDARLAEQSSERALSLLDKERDRTSLAYAWQARLRLVWRTLPEERAIAQSREALDAIERLRSSQAGESSRAGLFSNWTRDYKWLTGQLLQARQPRLMEAFEVGERLRARVLLERLARAGATSGDAEGPVASGQLQPRIAETQRHLLSTPLAESERRTLLDQLRLLEFEQEELTEGRFPALPESAIPFASLDDVQRMLADDEVMIWFSIAPSIDVYDEFGGGSWSVTITPQTATFHRLTPGDDLDAQVAGLLGLLRQRSTAPNVWAPAARRLGETLLGDALAQLPQTVTRLIIVTDGPLHRMPFEALSLESGKMLGERFDISVTPSATLWAQTRASRASSGAGVLVLADPDVPRGSPDGTVHLAPLPGARREAQEIASILNLRSNDVLQGPAASERFVKRAALKDFAVVHVAAHARADTTFPERSAVFLAPGDTAEDGWLQPAEIAALDFRGRLIVLSACDSAEGSLVSGEGPLSLARAFFAAGARTVVATRWPLRDDDAAFMMERFYEALSEGESVSAALRRARRDAIEAGLPAAAWAGVAVLGDGLLHPVAPRASRLSPLRVGVLLLLFVATAWWLKKQRK
ncbi:MAG TPA: CHAT domain-containing protein [Vicinamibacterales bacterium]|nr:CHAT domain-containing protein [Vicinamibacterales bacterium]